MPVYRDVPIHVKTETLLRSEGNTGHPVIVAEAARAAEKAVKLSEPAIVYRYFSSRTAGRHVDLDGVSLNIGPMAHLLENAVEAAVGLVTLGLALESEVNNLQDKNGSLEGYLLNCAAFAALDNTALYLKTRIEARAAEKGWGVGPALSPGTLPGWPAQGQSRLCSLLDLEQVNVTLTRSSLLIPRYSLAFLVGLGPGYSKSHVDSTCNYCSLKKHCPYRFPEKES